MDIIRKPGRVGDRNQGGRISEISTHYPEPGKLRSLLIESPEWWTEGRRYSITFLSPKLSTPEVL